MASYNSGYNHGCDDAKISNPNDRYINQPGTGPTSHSEEFMDGFNAGFYDCRESGGGESDESERDSDSGFSLGEESGGNGESDESETVSDPGSTDLENAESTLPIPEITQRIEPSPAEPKEEFVMRTEFEPSATFDSHWDPTGYGFDVSIGSEICPQDNCVFLIEDGKLRPDFTGGLLFEGTLKVFEQEEAGTRSKTYDMRGELVYEKTLGTGGGDILTNYTTDILKGKLKIGSGILVGPAPIEYNISKGYFYYNENEATLILEGAKDK
jgi:hypothetical protein